MCCVCLQATPIPSLPGGNVICQVYEIFRVGNDCNIWWNDQTPNPAMSRPASTYFPRTPPSVWLASPMMFRGPVPRSDQSCAKTGRNMREGVWTRCTTWISDGCHHVHFHHRSVLKFWFWNIPLRGRNEGCDMRGRVHWRGIDHVRERCAQANTAIIVDEGGKEDRH